MNINSKILFLSTLIGSVAIGTASTLTAVYAGEGLNNFQTVEKLGKDPKDYYGSYYGQYDSTYYDITINPEYLQLEIHDGFYGHLKLFKLNYIYGSQNYFKHYFNRNYAGLLVDFRNIRYGDNIFTHESNVPFCFTNKYESLTYFTNNNISINFSKLRHNPDFYMGDGHQYFGEYVSNYNDTFTFYSDGTGRTNYNYGEVHYVDNIWLSKWKNSLSYYFNSALILIDERTDGRLIFGIENYYTLNYDGEIYRKI